MIQKQINQSWKEFDLGEITECLDNQRIPITGSDREKGEIPYYGANGQQDFVADFIFDEELLLLAEDGGSWGYKQKCSYVIDGKSWVNNHAHVLRMKKDMINIKLLMYWFNLTDLNKYISGTTRGKLNQGVMKKIKIYLPILPNGTPDLEKQKQIVAILEKAEGLKDKRKGLNELFDEYLKSVFYEMFLKEDFESIEISQGIIKTENKNPQADFPNKEFTYVDIASIDNISKEITEIKKFLGKDAPSRARQQIKHNDILVSTVRPNLNAVALVSKKLDNQICSTGYCILRADKNNFISEFLFFVSRQDFFINELVNKTKGANYPAVSSRDIKSIKIPLPPIELQKKFASIVEQVEKIKDKLKDEKKDTDELFNALMQKAFSRELI